jgi:hypothetical protein
MGPGALLDDGEARACARALAVPVMGTLGVVLRARRLGRIASAAAVLRAVRNAGLYLDDHVIRAALLDLADEKWEP